MMALPEPAWMVVVKNVVPGVKRGGVKDVILRGEIIPELSELKRVAPGVKDVQDVVRILSLDDKFD